MPSSKQLATWANDPAAFRAALFLDIDGTPRPFRPDDWQQRDLVALDDGWRLVAGRYTGTGRPIMRAWREYPRGHGKTACQAIMASWALAFAAHPVHGIAAAGDKDQARLLRDSIATLVRVNPWLGSLLSVQQWRVTNEKNGSDLEVVSSDVSSSFGYLPDFVVADEVGTWSGERGQQFFGSLLSSAAKRENCLFCCILNASYRVHWSWELREKIRDDPDWSWTALNGSQASWITQKRLDEQRRLLPEQTFNRLWLNQWAEGSGDSAFLDTDIAAVFVDDLLPLSLEV